MEDRMFKTAVLLLLALAIALQVGVAVGFGTVEDRQMKSIEESISQIRHDLDSVQIDTQYTANEMVNLKTVAIYLQEKVEKGEIKSDEDLLKFLAIVLDFMGKAK